MNTIKTSKPGFIRDYDGNILLPITRAELIKNQDGTNALRIVKAHDQANGTSGGYPGLMDPKTLADILAKIGGSGTGSLSGLQGDINKIKDSIKVKGHACNLLEDILNFTDSTNLAVSKDASNNITFDFKDSVSFGSATVQNNPTNDNDVVNKAALDAALDAKFKDALDVAAGALHFKGGLSTSLSSAPEEGSYYKVTENFTFTQGSTSINVEVGDTLIYANKAWIHIPSGNETETAIRGTSGPALRGGINITTNTNSTGLITAQTTTSSDGYGGTITLGLQAASITNDTVISGYFNQSIYNKLKQLIPASSEYDPSVTTGYQIGTFTANSESTPIYIPTLVVDSSEPKIKYNGDTNAISIKTNNAIVASSSPDNSILIGLNVAANQPLTVKGNQLKLNVWNSTDNNDRNALITFDTFASGLFDNVLFIEVTKPSELHLNDTLVSYLNYTES